MLQTVSINTEQFFINALTDLKIDEMRANLLQEIGTFIGNRIKEDKQLNLNYICTHNSRRSQLAQIWSSYATNFYKIKKIENFSGGTAVTAFYRNTLKTLQEVGFKFQIKEFFHQNPEYLIHYINCTNPIIGFSKLYDHENNKKPFIAITTCSHADENCPFIHDAIQRFHLPFIDPKVFDNTPYQSEKYLETNKQIAGEIHYIFKMIEKSI
jgi:arsenate reductase